MSELILTDKNFSEEVLKSSLPVLVDFWAEWCVPCQMIAPIVQEISEEFAGEIKVGKINVDKNPLTATTFMVKAIPTLILFNEGKVAQHFVGLQPKEVIVQAISSLLQNNNKE